MYIHLATHSAYSLQEGLVTPADLVRTARACDMPALGLPDHNLLTGTIEFVTVCQESAIQPILGLEIDMDKSPLQLLATSLEGWSNLCRLSSALTLRDPPNLLDTLSAYSKDLIALSSKPQFLTDIFPNRLYVSLRNPSKAASLVFLARKFALPAVVTHPVYFLAP